MDCSMPGSPVHHQLLKLAQTHVYPVGDPIHPSHPLSSPSPPAFNIPSIRIFSNESALRIRWTKYWSFSFSISLSNEYSELISFMIDWSDLLADQGTLKSLLQCHSSKASKAPYPIPWQLLIYFLNWRICLLVCVQSLSQVLLFAAPCSINSPPSSSVHGIFQARILEWVAISYSRGSSWPRDWIHVSCVFCIVRRILYY